MTRAVYKIREDGDYDFVAAFAVDSLPDAPSDWPKEIADWLESQGEQALIVDRLDLNKLPDVLSRNKPLVLTVDQIKDLAEFAGLRVGGGLTEDERETEVAITKCPKRGVKDDDGSIGHYRHIAYFDEYPEEGVFPLGPKITK